MKRSDGYNVDEFVGDNSDVEYQSSESEYEGNDSDDSFDDGKCLGFERHFIAVRAPH